MSSRSPLPSLEPLKRLVGGRASDAREPVSAAERLRLSLAVRGWTSPTRLLPAVGGDSSILRTVAPDVLTSPEREPGCWYLSTDVRVHALAAAPTSVLHQELARAKAEEDANDPVFTAFRMALGLEEPTRARLSDLTLRALGNVVRWLDPAGRELQTLFDRIAAQLESEERQADLRRLTSVEMIGRERELAALHTFASRSGRGAWGHLYLHGAGGSGKTFLLRRFALEHSRRNPGAKLIELDLDRIELDPGDPATLDLELSRQLVVLMPELAPRLRTATREVLRARAGQAEDRRSRGERGPIVASSVADEAEFVDRAELESFAEDAGLHDLVAETGALLVVDTLEVAAARGADVLATLGAWLERLAERDVRMILAGRDRPSAEISRFLLDAIVGEREEVHLGELDESAAAKLLLDRGVPEEAAARVAARALPRNPLLLATAAEVYRDPGAREVAALHHARGEVDPGTAERYLHDRIVRHLPDRSAQKYLLAALCLPWIDKQIVAEVVAPAVDGGLVPPSKSASRILEALAKASWLASPAAEGDKLEWSDELRRLVLRLIPVAPSASDVGARVRLLAMVRHGRRRTPEDRAMLAYHMLAGGAATQPVLETVRDRPALELLARHADGLSSDTRDEILRRTSYWHVDRDDDRAALVRQRSDRGWLAYLEGTGSKSGTGNRLAASGMGREGIRLYRERPTRPSGTPPNFILQALAQEGAWNTDPSDPAHVDARRMLEELAEDHARSGSVDRERLYRLVLLELLRGEESVVDPVELADKALRFTEGKPDASLRSLLRVADALSGVDLLRKALPPRTAAAFLTTPRNLLPSPDGWTPLRSASVRLDAIVKLDAEWIGAFQQAERDGLVSVKGRKALRLDRVLGRLDGAPFTELAKLLRDLRLHTRFDMSWVGPRLAETLLTGLATELQKPLTAALRDLRELDPVAAINVLDRTGALMGARPREIRNVDELVGRNAAIWLPAFVGYADRCGLLPSLAASPELNRHPAAKATLRWEHALRPASWSPPPETRLTA